MQFPSEHSRLSDDGGCLWQVYEFNVPTFGKGVVFDVDHKVRAEQFRFFAEALKTSRLKLYVPQFVMEAEVRHCGYPCKTAPAVHHL